MIMMLIITAAVPGASNPSYFILFSLCWSICRSCAHWKCFPLQVYDGKAEGRWHLECELIALYKSSSVPDCTDGVARLYKATVGYGWTAPRLVWRLLHSNDQKLTQDIALPPLSITYSLHTKRNITMWHLYGVKMCPKVHANIDSIINIFVRH